MTRRALVIEIEELLFDTLHVRAEALHDALEQEGAHVSRDAVVIAHDGVPAALAIEQLSPVLTLDATGRELVLHRAAALASRVFEVQAPSFDTAVRDLLAALAADVPLAVVTRATPAQAQRWLAAAGLEACVATVASLADLEPGEYAAAWGAALRRVHATQGVAIAAPLLLQGAAIAGLRTVHIGDASDRVGNGYHPDAQLASLSPVHANWLASLCPDPHVIQPP